MEIKRVGSQASAKGSPEWFTGAVRVDPLFQAPDPALVSGASVTFEPGARTAWHTHPLGQTLIVTAGCGWTTAYRAGATNQPFARCAVYRSSALGEHSEPRLPAKSGHSPLRSIAVVDPHLSERRSQLSAAGRRLRPRAVRTKSVLAWLTVSCIADGTRRNSGGRSELFWRGSPFRIGAFAEPLPIVLPPYQQLSDAAAELGHNFLFLDDDTSARRMTPFIVSDGKELPSLGVAAALIAGGFRPGDVSAANDSGSSGAVSPA